MNDEPVIPEGLSKSERKKIKREFYREREQKESKTRPFKKYAMIGGIILIVAGGGYWMVKEVMKPLPGEFIATQGNKHIQSTDEEHDPYNSLPPTSGPHLGEKANWGISESLIPDELQIHNLEDGGVVVQYNCTPGTETQEKSDECKQLIGQLSDIVKKYPDKVILAPYPKLDTKIAVTAWTRIDKFNEFDGERITKFIKTFKGIDHHRG